MFCPKCGTKNPEDGKFCRSCGVDLGNVSAALSVPAGRFTVERGARSPQLKSDDRRDPAEVYGDSIKEIISGLGFLTVALVLLFTGVAGGKAWWWSMLIPAFTFFAKGVSDLLKSRKMESSAVISSARPQDAIPSMPERREIATSPEDYVSPGSVYNTGDLVPPSVTDNTTRHLEIDKDGETMTLRKP